MPPGIWAAWDGAAPLRCGTAIRIGNKVGTLGAAVRLGQRTWFTTAYHVIDDYSGSVDVWTLPAGATTPVWQATSALTALPPSTQPGVTISYPRADTRFLKTQVAGLNVIDGQNATASRPCPAVADDRLVFQGLLDATSKTCVVVGRYDPANPTFQAHFGVVDNNQFAHRALVVVRFDAPRPDGAAYKGDSGTSLWSATTDGWACLGHLSAVSSNGTLALAIGYDEAFRFLGVPTMEVAV